MRARCWTVCARSRRNSASTRMSSERRPPAWSRSTTGQTRVSSPRSCRGTFTAPTVTETVDNSTRLRLRSRRRARPGRMAGGARTAARGARGRSRLVVRVRTGFAGRRSGRVGAHPGRGDDCPRRRRADRAARPGSQSRRARRSRHPHRPRRRRPRRQEQRRERHHLAGPGIPRHPRSGGTEPAGGDHLPRHDLHRSLGRSDADLHRCFRGHRGERVDHSARRRHSGGLFEGLHGTGGVDRGVRDLRGAPSRMWPARPWMPRRRRCRP